MIFGGSFGSILEGSVVKKLARKEVFLRQFLKNIFCGFCCFVLVSAIDSWSRRHEKSLFKKDAGPNRHRQSKADSCVCLVIFDSFWEALGEHVCYIFGSKFWSEF